MRSKLLILHQFMAELTAETNNKEDIEVGFPQDLFNQFKLENCALLNKFDQKSKEAFGNINEFKFHTGHGSLIIYNKDQK